MEDDNGMIVTLLGHECGTKQLDAGLGRSIGSGALAMDVGLGQKQLSR